MRRTCALGLSSLVLGATFSPRLSLPVVTRAASSPRFATTAEDVSVAAAAEVAPTPGRSRLKAKPIGVGACAPDDVITNEHLATLVDTSDSWVKTRTGISRRHVMAPGEQFRTIAETAARRAIENSGVNPLDVGLVIFATSCVHLRRAGRVPARTTHTKRPNPLRAQHARRSLRRCARDCQGDRCDQCGRIRPHRCLLGIPVCDGDRLAVPAHRRVQERGGCGRRRAVAMGRLGGSEHLYPLWGRRGRDGAARR